MWALTLQTHSSVIIYVLVAALYVFRPRFRNETGIESKWYLAAWLAFIAGYANMIYYNLVSCGGSFRWIVHKPYALETSPGLSAYTTNLQNMFIELFRSVSSTYASYQNPWAYLAHPGFLAAVCLFSLGSYLVVKKGKALPLWMIVGAFIVIPWVNERYVFYLATRYIMPVIICALLVTGYGLAYLVTGVYQRVGVGKAVLAPIGAALGVLIVLQLVPYYGYCKKLAGTNESNLLTLKVLSSVQRLARNRNTLVVIDKRLPLENNPLPYVLSLSRQPYKVLPENYLESGMLKNLRLLYPNHELVAVVTNRAYEKIRAGTKIEKVNRLTCRVTLPPSSPGKRTIYVIKMP